MSTTANKIVKVTHIDPEQTVIRCTARVDMPEYGIKAGDVFFLSRGSEADMFYVVTYDDQQNKYTCGHPARKNAKICTHIQAVSTYCRDRAAREKAICLATPPPIKSIADRGSLNGNRPFSLLKAS